MVVCVSVPMCESKTYAYAVAKFSIFQLTTAVSNHSAASSVHIRPLKYILFFNSVGVVLVPEPQTLCFTYQNVAKGWHDVIASLFRSLSHFLENAQPLLAPGYQSFFEVHELGIIYILPWPKKLKQPRARGTGA